MDKQTIIKGMLATLVLSAAIAIGVYNKPGDRKDLPADTAIDADPGALTTELLTEVVPPTKVVVTSVNFPSGYLYVPGTLSLSGEAVGRFVVHDVKQVGPELKVMAENTSKDAVRFTALLAYDIAARVPSVPMDALPTPSDALLAQPEIAKPEAPP